MERFIFIVLCENFGLFQLDVVAKANSRNLHVYCVVLTSFQSSSFLVFDLQFWHAKSTLVLQIFYGLAPVSLVDDDNLLGRRRFDHECDESA